MRSFSKDIWQRSQEGLVSGFARLVTTVFVGLLPHCVQSCDRHVQGPNARGTFRHGFKMP
jgi:hypothetical protein